MRTNRNISFASADGKVLPTTPSGTIVIHYSFSVLFKIQVGLLLISLLDSKLIFKSGNKTCARGDFRCYLPPKEPILLTRTEMSLLKNACKNGFHGARSI